MLKICILNIFAIENEYQEKNGNLHRSLSQDDTLNTRYANTKKRRQSEPRKMISQSLRPNVADDGNESDRDIPKNIDRNMHFSNELYRTLCVLCNKNERFLVAHYANRHQDQEVFIARMSPAMTNAIRKQSQPFELRNNKITGFCFFCEEFKTMAKNSWMHHILSHTGEQLYVCTSCNVRIKQKNEHRNCRQQVIKNVFELSSSTGDLSGFICKECNYFQINRSQILKHLVKEHGIGERGSVEHIELVNLIPNLSPIKSSVLFSYGFIEAARLSKCTLCKHQSNSIEQFESHLTEHHGYISRYNCCCGKKLKLDGDNPRDRCVSSHLFLHNRELFYCMMCDDKQNSIFFTENGILQHITLDHTEDEVKYQFVHYNSSKRKALTEFTVKKFTCRVCSEGFQRIGDALNHFKIMHKTKIVDFNAVVIERTTELEGEKSVTKMAHSANNKSHMLRQCFLCIKCNFRSSSKEIFLAHHRERHGSDALEIHLTHGTLVHRDPLERENINVHLDAFVAYSCYWCRESNENETFISGNVASIHEHWQSTHIEPLAMPFQFNVEMLGKCIDCDMISTFKGLQEHSNSVHRKNYSCYTDLIDSKQCPMCDFTGDSKNLRKHFKSSHSWIQEVDMINPNRMKPELIDQLLAIDVHKKYQCDYCDSIFETKKACEDHHKQKHPRKKALVKQVFDNSCTAIKVSCCDTLVRPQNYFSHLSAHQFEYSCPHCNIKFKDITQAALHDLSEHSTSNPVSNRCVLLEKTLRKLFFRSKMIFGNGAVLYKCNLLGSVLDDSETFNGFVQAHHKEHQNEFNHRLGESSDSGTDYPD